MVGRQGLSNTQLSLTGVMYSLYLLQAFIAIWCMSRPMTSRFDDAAGAKPNIEAHAGADVLEQEMYVLLQQTTFV